MDNRENEEIIRFAINYVLSKFNKEGKNSFWNNKGYLNINELYRYLLSQRGFKSFESSHKFESYIKYGVRKFNLTGKIDTSAKKKEDKFIEAVERIENFNYALVEHGKEPGDNDYVVRTKMGNGGVRFYVGGMLNDDQITQIKIAYHITENIKYFDVRPCKYKNWKNWSEERQQASMWKEEMAFTR
jgi:hypothetical protein